MKYLSVVMFGLLLHINIVRCMEEEEKKVPPVPHCRELFLPKSPKISPRNCTKDIEAHKKCTDKVKNGSTKSSLCRQSVHKNGCPLLLTAAKCPGKTTDGK